MSKIQFSGATNVVIEDVRRGSEIVIPAGTRVEVDDTALPGFARHNGKVYPVRLEQMSSHEIMVDGVYVPGCGPQVSGE